LELDDELHDGAGGLVVTGVCDWMSRVEYDAGGIRPVPARQPLDHAARLLDPAGERVAGGAVPLAVSRRGSRGPLLPGFDLDRVAEGLDLGKPARGIAPGWG